MSESITVIEQLNALTPLGLAGGLGYIIYLLIRQGKGQSKIANNHLHPLPEMSETLKRMEETQREELRILNEIARDQAYIKARLNGKQS